MTLPIIRVLVPLGLDKPLDYLWPDPTPPVPGQVVEVPVGRQKVPGLVIECLSTSPFDRLKTATPVPGLVLTPDQLQFLQWVPRYTLGYPGDAWRAALPKNTLPDHPKPTLGWVATGQKPSKLTPKRQAVLKLVSERLLTTSEICTALHISPQILQAMARGGLLEQKPIDRQKNQEISNEIHEAHLTSEQQQASQAIIAAMQHKSFWPTLLDGITGSGKTEVYFATLAHLLSNSSEGQALVLLPEIALTPQWLQRFAARFGFTPAVWHSATSEGAKAATWWGVHQGSTRVVVGARSALFLPFKNLRLVVVDEEHDASYKQEEGGMIYHARDMAVVRAKLAQCPVVLASATPALETWQNVLAGRFGHLVLANRYQGAKLPRIDLVNMVKNGPAKADHYLSPALVSALQQNFRQGQQSLLFLNRRGYAPLLICRACGHRHDCPRCSASLVVHGPRLECHHCGFNEPKPDTCPQCHSDKLHPFGPGTRRIAEEVKIHLPEAKIAVADRDALSSVKQIQDMVQALEEGQVDILIGTQMVAKGHHFPNLTLVGVVDADMGLAQGDLRAAEKTFQLITQVAGRAGRGAVPGEVLVQTHAPEHPLFAAITALDREAFYTLELNARQRSRMPPFGRMVALVLEGRDEAQVARGAARLAAQAPILPDWRLLGPAPAPLKKRRDLYRYRLLLITPEAPHKGLHTWLQNTPLPKGVTLKVDVDPQSFL